MLGRGFRVGAPVVAGLLALLLLGLAAEAEPRRWVPVAGRSQVGFGAGFPLGDFTGRGEDLSGEFRADPSDLRLGVTGTLRVAVQGLRTGVSGRDRDMWKVMEAERFPRIRFAVESVESSFPAITDKADVLLTIKGSLLIRDVERPMTFLGRVRFRDDRLWVRGEATLRMTDFGIPPPKKLFLAVRDQMTVSFDLTLAPAE